MLTVSFIVDHFDRNLDATSSAFSWVALLVAHAR